MQQIKNRSYNYIKLIFQKKKKNYKTNISQHLLYKHMYNIDFFFGSFIFWISI